MKKIFLIAILLSFSLVSAEHYSGETVQLYFNTVVSGMSLYCNNEKVSFSPLLNDYQEGKMVYFDLSSDVNGSCTFLYSLGNKTFDVARSDNILRVKPAIVILGSKGSFSLELNDVNGTYTVNVASNSEKVVPRKSSVDLEKGNKVNLYFDYEIFYGESLITLSYDNRSYEVIVVGEEEEIVGNESVENESIDEGSLVFLVTKNVDVNIRSNETVHGELKVQNNYKHSIDNLVYSLSGNLRDIVSFEDENVSLGSGEIYSNIVYFNRGNSSETGEYSGSIILSNSEYSIELPIDVSVVGADEHSESTYVVFNQTVIDIDNEEEGNGIYIIGIVLIALLVALIVLVILKLRQRNEKSFEEYINGTKRKFK
jgi:hypothetical protein